MPNVFPPSLKQNDVEKNQNSAIDFLIKQYEEANLNLRIAMEQEVESSILNLSQKVDQAFDNLMKYECTTQTERRALCRLLIERFIINDENKDSMFNRTCEKILSEI